MSGSKFWFVPPLPEGADFQVRGIGRREDMRPGVVDRPSGTGDYLLMYFHGPVEIRDGRGLQAYHDARLIAWNPEQGHHYGNRDQRWCHTWLHCTGSFVERMLKKSGFPVNRAISLPDPVILEKALSALHDELSGHARPDEVILENIFENLLRELSRASRTSREPSPVPEKFLGAKRYMEANYAEGLTLESLAVGIHLSVPHFCSEFKRYFGISPIDYVIRLRMYAAMHHLRNVNYRVSEIAEMVGYEDIFYFSKLFKRRFGVSPRAMRRRMSEEENH